MTHFERETQKANIASPDNYEAELVPQAINLMVGIMRVHPRINMHLKDVDESSLVELNKCQDLDAFKDSVRNIFNDHTAHIIQRTNIDLDNYLKVLHGQEGRTLGQIFEDAPQVVLEVHDIRNTAKNILQKWEIELITEQLEEREPVLMASPVA